MPKVAILYKDLQGAGCKKNRAILLENEQNAPPPFLYLQYNISPQVHPFLFFNRLAAYYRRTQQSHQLLKLLRAAIRYFYFYHRIPFLFLSCPLTSRRRVSVLVTPFPGGRRGTTLLCFGYFSYPVLNSQIQDSKNFLSKATFKKCFCFFTGSCI